ncbi:CpsL protein [Streptococcus agalactiae LMG 14747]|uniref:CpsL protein n=1 Tax=Streptococcus agalactiae LMG 14747 TaxID=1154860 RepID=V6Z129_STRAG|nr:CpsL protein [Streptococcus agalactiae LMG 14747]
MSTVVGDLYLNTRGDEIRLLFCYVQSEVNPFLKVVKVAKAKSVAFDTLDEFISCFQFGIRIGKLDGIGDIVF